MKKLIKQVKNYDYKDFYNTFSIILIAKYHTNLNIKVFLTHKSIEWSYLNN